MTIVNLAARRRALAEELLVEAQVLANERGHQDIAALVLRACVLLTSPDPEPVANVVPLRARAKLAA